MKVAVVPVLVAVMGLLLPSGASGWLANAPFQVTLAPWWIFTQLGEYWEGAAPLGKVMVASPLVTVVVLGSQPFTTALPLLLELELELELVLDVELVLELELLLELEPEPPVPPVPELELEVELELVRVVVAWPPPPLDVPCVPDVVLLLHATT